MIKSTVKLKNTSEKRRMKDVLLKEFLPIEEDILDEGIDSKNSGTKFFDWADLLQDWS